MYKKKNLKNPVLKNTRKHFKAQGKSKHRFHFTKKNLRDLLTATFVTLVLLLSSLFYISKNKITAEILIDEFVAALKSKLGFEYAKDPLSDYVFNKATPNYNAFAADKKQSGRHRIMLERSGRKLEVKFQSAEYSKENQQSEEVSSDEATSSAAPKNLLERTLDNINQELQDVTSDLQEISQKIGEVEESVSEITSRAKLVAGDHERKVLFENIVYGIDLDYTLDEGGIKQEIVIRDKNILKDRFSFTLTHPGLNYRDLGRGVWYFSEDKNHIIRLPKAYATDAKGQFSNDVDIRIKTTLLVTIMTVSVPTDWLTSPDRAYPVTIHTGFEIVPSLRDGKSSGLDTTITPAQIDILPTDISTFSSTLEATDSSKIEP